MNYCYQDMKKVVKLTENDIKKMVMETMNELDWKTYANAAKKRFDQLHDDSVEGTWKDKFNKAYGLEKAANKAFDDEYIGNMKYDTMGDKLRGKHSPTFDGRFSVDASNMPYGAINGSNKGGGKIFSTDKGVYHANNGGLTSPGKFFRDKEVADAYSKANDELWDYHKGNYNYEKGKGWSKNELEESVSKAIKQVLNEDTSEQWKSEARAFMQGLRSGNVEVSGDTAYVQIWKSRTAENDPRYVYFRRGDNRLHDDHFYIQDSPKLSTRTINTINRYLGWTDEYNEEY